MKITGITSFCYPCAANVNNKNNLYNSKNLSSNKLKSDEFTFCARKETKSQKNVLRDALSNSIHPLVVSQDVSGILSSLGYDIRVDKEGFITLNGNYDSANAFGGLSFKELGIDESVLLNKIKHIKGNCSLNNPDGLLSSGALESVGKDFFAANVKNFSNLRKIGGNAFFKDNTSKYTISSQLSVNGTAFFSESLDDIVRDDLNPAYHVKAGDKVYLTL